LVEVHFIGMKSSRKMRLLIEPVLISDEYLIKAAMVKHTKGKIMKENAIRTKGTLIPVQGWIDLKSKNNVPVNLICCANRRMRRRMKIIIPSTLVFAYELEKLQVFAARKVSIS
jgi:hypothetical protein